jgi:ATP-dependent exoDNAse (exonuclease V) alpha subunit
VGRDPEGLLELDLLVVLGASQLDTETAAALAEALPDGARLVLSGDPALLGSAGAGQVLADLLAAGVCPRVISRTPDPGPVGELVSSVGIGELVQVAAPAKEVVVVPVQDAGEALHRTAQLVTESIPRAFGQDAAGIQVITPAHGGAVGTRALNSALKERLNPGPGRFGGFDPGDRVAWSPAPGQTLLGVLTGPDEAGTGLRLDCGGEGEQLTVPAGDGALRHAWAITAHQAAGRRWPAAVVVVPGDAGAILDRAWVYTAFGRAERHLSVVQGAGPALAGAVAGVPAARRTRLPTLLRLNTAAP